MNDFEATDFFRDASVVEDPFWYFDEARSRCPVYRESHHDVMLVTGYDEARAIYHGTETFSSATSVTGPFPGFPVPLEGDDVSDLIEEHRDGCPSATNWSPSTLRSTRSTGRSSCGCSRRSG